MKKIFLRRTIMIVLIFCMCAANIAYFPPSKATLAAADTIPVSKPYYDEEGEYRFRYYDDEVLYRIQIDIEELEWLSASGVMEKLYAEEGSLYVEIFVSRKGYVIPKEFINILNKLRCNAYCFVKIGEEEYDWGLSPSTSFAEQDFSPYVTFSAPERYAAAYDESTKYVQLQTQYDIEKSGFQAMISIASFCMGGKKYKTSDYFQDFFQYYSIEDIVEVNDDWRDYGYRLHNIMQGSDYYPEEIGYFHITEFGDDGVKKRHWKECEWTYHVNTVYSSLTFANLELHQLNHLIGGSFVLSDADSIADAGPYEPSTGQAPDLSASASPSPAEIPNPDETLPPAEIPAPGTFPESSATPSPSGMLPPVESTAPGETLQPVESTTPGETLQPIETPDSGETLPPTETPDSGGMLPPTETPNPSETLPPTELPKPAGAASQTSSPKQNVSGLQTGSLKKLTGTVTKDNKIKLKWNSHIPQGASKLVLYRKASEEQSYVKLKKLSLSQKNYLDKKTDKGKKYTYKLLCIDSSGKYMESMKAVSQTIAVPYFEAPKMKLSAVTQDGEKYLKVKVSQYSGRYAEIYLSRDGKTYKKVVLKKSSISRYNGQFLLSYQKSMGKIYCKVRTWSVKKGKKRYSHYSDVKKIKLD